MLIEKKTPTFFQLLFSKLTSNVAEKPEQTQYAFNLALNEYYIVQHILKMSVC